MISPLIDPALDTELAQIALGADNLPTSGIDAARENGEAAGREILCVADYTLVAASHYSSTGLGLSTAGTEAHVLLTGAPAEGSAARRGILRLVPTDKLRAPEWDAAAQTIDLTLHHSVLPMVLTQLEKPRRVLWMAVFEDGRSYGDLHAAS